MVRFSFWDHDIDQEEGDNSDIAMPDASKLNRSTSDPIFHESQEPPDSSSASPSFLSGTNRQKSLRSTLSAPLPWQDKRALVARMSPTDKQEEAEDNDDNHYSFLRRRRQNSTGGQRQSSMGSLVSRDDNNENNFEDSISVATWDTASWVPQTPSPPAPPTQIIQYNYPQPGYCQMTYWFMALIAVVAFLTPYTPWWPEFLEWRDRYETPFVKPCPPYISSALSSSPGNGKEDTCSANEAFLRDGLVGQDFAMRLVSQTLEAWDSSKPLLLLFSGLEGVGKSETARLLEKLVFHQYCPYGDDHQLPPRRLVIQGTEYASSRQMDVVNEEIHYSSPSLSEQKALLYSTIVRFIQQQQGSGGIIVFEQIEKIDPALLNLLCEDLSVEGAGVSPLSSHDQASILLDNVIFVFTTSLGVREKIRLVDKYGGIEKVPPRKWEEPIRLAIDADDNNIASACHALVPFRSLDISDLAAILERRVEEESREHGGEKWKRLVVTEAARFDLVGPKHVSYKTLSMTSSGFSETFSETGAKPVRDGDGSVVWVMRSLLRKCLVRPRPTKVAVIDYNADADEASFTWCGEDGRGNIDWHDCTRVCMGKLQSNEN